MEMLKILNVKLTPANHLRIFPSLVGTLKAPYPVCLRSGKENLNSEYINFMV